MLFCNLPTSKINILWISRCCLQDLSGLDGLPNISELYASFNLISDVSPLSCCRHLSVVDLESNQIETLDNTEFMCSNVCLAHLTLLGNSIARLKYYRTSVASRLPQLKFLDDKEISNSERSRLTNTEECIIDEKYIAAENRKLKAFEIVSSHSNRSLFSTPTSISPPIGSNSVSNSECLSGGSS
eukprot:526854_1